MTASSGSSASGGGGYQELYERAEPLVERINLQQAYGTQDFTSWLMELVRPQPADAVLDIGCGNGQHLIALCGGCRQGVGVDLSQELLEAARRTAETRGLAHLRFFRMSGDHMDLGDERFEIILCSFALYYMDAPAVIARMRRHVHPTGRIYVTGSPDENAQELLAIHGRATSFLPDVYAPGFSDIRKYEPVFAAYFRTRIFHRFINPLRFPTVDAFMAYYCSTTLFQRSREAVDGLEQAVERASREIWEAQKEIRITKIVETIELRDPRS